MPPSSKICSRCSDRKNLTEFSTGKGRFGKASWCKDCHSEYNDRHQARRAQNYQDNKEARQKTQRNSYLVRNYGITSEEFEQMESDQGRVCFLCGGSNLGKRLAVDHCHETGTVRSLLCDLCNRGLGLFRDNPDLLRSAAEYLEKFK